MTKFETLFCAALANSAICNGNATEPQLDRWFGESVRITREEIAALQAAEYAKQALKYLERLSG